MSRRKRKTPSMRVLELTHNKEIREIMLELFRQHGSERAAAESMNIRQQTFNQWKFRLGIEDDIYQIQCELRRTKSTSDCTYSS